MPGKQILSVKTVVTFTNLGDVPRTATSFEKGNWDTGTTVPLSSCHYSDARNF